MGMEKHQDLYQIQGPRLGLHRLSVAAPRDLESSHLRLGWGHQTLGLRHRLGWGLGLRHRLGWGHQTLGLKLWYTLVYFLFYI